MFRGRPDDSGLSGNASRGVRDEGASPVRQCPQPGAGLIHAQSSWVEVPPAVTQLGIQLCCDRGRHHLGEPMVSGLIVVRCSGAGRPANTPGHRLVTVLVDDLNPAMVTLMGWDRQGCRVAGLTSLLGFELDKAGVVGVDVEVPQEPGQNDGGAGVDLVRVQLEQAVTATQPLIGECRDHVSGRPRHVRGSEPRQAWGEPRNGLSGQPRQLEDHLSGQSARCGLSPRVTRLSGGLARRSRVHSSAACGRSLTVKVTKLKVSYSKSCPYGGRWTKS